MGKLYGALLAAFATWRHKIRTAVGYWRLVSCNECGLRATEFLSKTDRLTSANSNIWTESNDVVKTERQIV